MRIRLIVWSICMALTMGANLAYSLVTSEYDTAHYGRVVWFVCAGATGLVSVFLMPNLETRCARIGALFGPAILLRCILLLAAPSDDVNRYLWEGRLVNEGISPYAQTADSPELEAYRDMYWVEMNHKDKATAYPPLTELSFAVMTRIAYHPMSVKVFYAFMDLVVLGGIIALLRRRGLSVGYAAFYSLNPLALVAFAGEGHFDVLMLAAVVWGLWAWDCGRRQLAISLIALATGIKWITLPLIPFFLQKQWLRGALLAGIILALPAVYFWETLPALFNGLLAFGGSGSFNGPIYESLLLGLGLSRELCTGVVLVVFAGIVGWRWTLRAEQSMETHIRWILGGLILLSPTVHFWYLVWILPFVCLRPSLPWLSFSLSAGIYFMVWMHQASGVGWSLSVLERLIFWGPFTLALVYELWSTRGRVLCARKRIGVDGGEVPSISVVIPIYNVGDRLHVALNSIEAQTRQVTSIILVEAGDIEATRVQVSERRCAPRVISSELGRGQQIATGIEAAASDWVIVLHADGQLPVDAVEKLQMAAVSDPNLIGGAFGQRFVEQTLVLVLIEALNDFRALLTRTAFGDQVQFFHRESALCYGLMPKQPLMEDVESSWRIREQGTFVYLGAFSAVSAEKWIQTGWWRRIRLVFSLIARYRWARLRGPAAAEALSGELYQAYYPKSRIQQFEENT